MKRVIPLVSVIIPTLNNEATIGSCLETMRRQTYKNIEIIVVDEYSKSKDKTLAIAKGFGAKIYYGGPERSIKRNIGIENARGKYVLIIDSDQELDTDLVEDCIAKIKNFDFLAIPELPFGPDFWARCHRFEKLAYLDGFSPVEGARFFTKRLVTSIGGYDPEMVGAEDWDLTQRLLMAGYKMGYTKAILHHNDGPYDLKRALKKKFYYGKAFKRYAARYPEAFFLALTRPVIWRNLKLFFSHPLLFLGSILRRFLEGSAVLLGMWLYRK